MLDTFASTMPAWRLAFFAVLSFGPQGVAQTPPPRAGHVMTTAGPTGGVLLVGGQIIDNTPRLADTLWHWDGAAQPDTTGGGIRHAPQRARGVRRRRDRQRHEVRRHVEWNGQRWTERNLQ